MRVLRWFSRDPETADPVLRFKLERVGNGEVRIIMEPEGNQEWAEKIAGEIDNGSEESWNDSLNALSRTYDGTYSWAAVSDEAV